MFCVSAPSVSSVQKAIEYIFPLVYEFRKDKTAEDDVCMRRKSRKGKRTADREDDEFGAVKEEEDEQEEEEEDMVDDGGWD